jgi:hypothetical protein
VLDWDRAAEAFERDGAMRDLFVPGTNEEDWEALLAFLRAGAWPVEYLVDGRRPGPLPGPGRDPFARGPEDPVPLLRVDPGGLDLHCHFRRVSEIEFVLDPRDADGPAWLARLLAFMRDLTTLLRKPVLLGDEGLDHDHEGYVTWLRVGPDPPEVVWVPQ